MAEIPTKVVTSSDIEQWQTAVKELAAWKAKEMLLRKRIFNGIFPNPIEGIMKVPIGNVMTLTAVHKVTRDIDGAALATYVRMFHEQGIPIDSLIKYNPSLVISEYRKLSDEQRLMFDHILIIKPGSPTLKIEQAKEKK